MTREQIKRRLEQLAELRKAQQARVADIIERSLGANRTQTEEEATQVDEARSEVDRIDGEVAQLNQLDDELRQAEESETGTSINATGQGEHRTEEQRAAEAGQARQRAAAVVTREPRTYERHDIRTSYLRDLTAAQLGHGSVDPSEARERLAKHATEVRVDLPRIEARLAAARGGYVDEVRAEGEDRSAEVRYEQERRDLSRTDGAGGEFVPPLWMVEDWISVSRASRVFADRCRNMPLPAGTDSINIPRVATGTSVAAQTADNAAVSDTDATTDSVSASVRTIAGQQDVAMQVLDQSPVAFDQVIFADLAEEHAVQLDTQALNGSNASGQMLGAFNIPSVDTTAYTDASPTVPELYPKLADSANEVATNRHRPVEAIFMHPRRWYWILSDTDASNRPLVVMTAQGPQNALMVANGDGPSAEGAVGMTPFGAVFLDANIPTNFGTNEDRILMGRPSEYYLWESPVRTRVLQEVGSGTLTVRFQLFNYAAFMPHRRPESTSVVAGTGLIAPTF